ncbi:MAG: hypothetical protein ACQEXJ_09695 [Myxococcota bacterium]
MTRPIPVLFAALALSAASLLTACEDDGDATDTPRDVADVPGDAPADVPDTAHDTSDLTPAPDTGLLVDAGGCADLVMSLGSEADDLVLVFDYQGEVAKAAYEAESGEASATLDVATEASLELRQGTKVTALVCNDALDGSEEVVTTWTATAGTAHVEVVSDGIHEPWDAYPGDATITLTDVVLEAEGAEQVVIPTLTWSAAVGWLPG